MDCPKCLSKSTVIDSRKIHHGKVYRRRLCMSAPCGYRWRTYESPAEVPSRVELKAQMREVAAELARLARYVLEIQSSVE